MFRVTTSKDVTTYNDKYYQLVQSEDDGEYIIKCGDRNIVSVIPAGNDTLNGKEIAVFSLVSILV